MTSPRFVASLLAAATLLGAAPARADLPVLDAPELFWEPLETSAGAPGSATVAPERPASAGLGWYGWQTLALDASSALLLAAAGGTESTAVGMLGVGGHLAGPPILHFLAHDSNGRALVSLALRLVLPMAGFLIGAGADCDDQTWFCIPDEAWIGYGGGMLAASVLDAALISWE